MAIRPHIYTFLLSRNLINKVFVSKSNFQQGIRVDISIKSKKSGKEQFVLSPPIELSLSFNNLKKRIIAVHIIVRTGRIILK
jgi:hypothetical protein